MSDLASSRQGYAVTDLTIGHVIRDKAAKLRDAQFLSYIPDGRTFTFADVDRASNILANGLMALGIKPGDHVALMMANRPEMLFLLMALGKIGAVSVPLNIAARGDQMRHYLSQSDSVVLVVEEAFLAQLDDVEDALLNLGKVVLFRESSTAKEVPDRVGACARLQTTDFAQLEEAPDSAPDVVVKFSDLAMLLYTSGTTGLSKAVMFTQAYALLYGIDQVENYGFRSSDTVYVCTPLFHAHGLLSHTYGPLVLGAKVALSLRFSASHFWNEVRDCGATVLSMLGSMANMLWSQPPSADDARHAVRQATIAPAPSAGVQFSERFGMNILGAYGLTDYGMGTILGPDEFPRKVGSAGRPRPGMQVRVVDENDMPLPTGEIGEIVMRSDIPWSTSLGYYKMPDATLAARRNFWFHTGDRGYFDADGYLFFGDRKKDAIRRRGENISAFEIEQVLAKHDAVADVAVFAAPSGVGEDEVACALVVKPGMTLSEAQVIEYCGKHMPYYMVPRYLQFLPDLPRSATHKVEKYKLQKAAAERIDSFWDREKAGIALRRR